MNLTQLNAPTPVVLYQLRSVTPEAAPQDSDGTWFRYVIAQGLNEITGLRAGNATEVEVAVREMVDNLNERSRGKSAKTTKPASAASKAASPAKNQS